MNEKDDREQLERKLAQTRRLAAQASDLTTKERLAEVVDELKQDEGVGAAQARR